MANQFDNNLKKIATKKGVLVFTVLWFLGTALLTIAVTNLFTESPFQRKYTFIGFMMLINTIFLIRLWILHLSGNKI